MIPEFARLYATGERRSPATAAVAQLISEGVDPNDADAIDAWIEANRHRLDRRLLINALTSTATPTADLHALPDDGRRWELIDGSLIVSPSPKSSRRGRLADRSTCRGSIAKRAA